MTETLQTSPPGSAPGEAIERRHSRVGLVELARWTGVAVGAVLIVATAYFQPYNQNELQQIAPYGHDLFHVIVNGTRQPPLGPFLGGIVQHLVGTGQLVQRAVPVASGVGTLALMGLLFRRLGLGWAGVFGVWLMATAPLMMRFSAYTRPYALPVFCMCLLVYGAVRWFERPRVVWLLLVAVGAVALPLSRVPEPVLYLLTTVVVLAFLSWRGRYRWRVSLPVITVCVAALAFVGYPMFHQLATQTGPKLFDPNPAHVVDNLGPGAHEIATFLIPFLGELFPWWPLTLLTVVAAVLVPASRRRLAQWWWFWPLLAAPVGFALAYHFLNDFPFSIRPYRARMAYFFVPPYVVLVVALATAVLRARGLARSARVLLAALLAATLVGQLPASARTLTVKQAVDFGEAAQVLTRDLPGDAVVVYDAPSPAGRWRQPFLGTPRYMGNKPLVVTHKNIAIMEDLGRHRPVYLLMLDSRCAYTVVCDAPRARWRHPLRGWQVLKRFDRFTLYRPTEPTRGREGVTRTLTELGSALGPGYGDVDTFAAAVLLRQAGERDEARRLVTQMYDRAPFLLEWNLRIHAPSGFGYVGIEEPSAGS